MATVSHAPGLRPELGATTGEIAVGSVSELVFWGPTQGARALGRGVVRNRNPGACPSLIPRLSQRTALIAVLAGCSLAAPGTAFVSSSGLDTWAEFQGDRGSRTGDVSGVPGIEGSCCSASGQKEACWELKGEGGSGSLRFLESAAG